MVPLAGIKLTKHREPMMLGLNLTDVLPTAWLSMFGKWLPFEQLVEVVPFLAASGLPGFLAITIVILTSRLGQRQWNFNKTCGFCMFLLFGGWACATVFNLCASQVPIGPLGPSERGGCFDLHRNLAQVAGTQQFDVFVSANSSGDQGPGSRLTTSGTSELKQMDFAHSWTPATET